MVGGTRGNPTVRGVCFPKCSQVPLWGRKTELAIRVGCRTPGFDQRTVRAMGFPTKRPVSA